MMGLNERIDSWLMRNYRVVTAIFISGMFIASVCLPFFVLIQNEGDLNQEINPSIVNGI